MSPSFFIQRPIFAAVLSILITLLGGLAYFGLPVSQYPDVVPPTVVVSTFYPGANAQTLAETVATPLEQEINGVENMLYISSSSTSDGRLSLTITFKLGTNLDQAQVQVQNRVSVALPRLPEDVRRQGVNVTKRSPDLTMAVQFYSPDGTRDTVYLANYVTLQVINEMARLPGVSEASMLGGLDFTMRLWLDPERLAARNLTAGDVLRAVREQNVQIAAGQLGQPPAKAGLDFQYTLVAPGRLISTEEFGDIVIKTGSGGDTIRLSDVARIELGAKDYAVKTYMDGFNAVSLRIFQLPGSNALATADAVYKRMSELASRFPPGVGYRINYDPTQFVKSSMKSVLHTLLEAIALVVLVVILFLQTWRASIIPLVAVPVSLIGTLAIMSAFGFSLNNLSLFGLVLAIGIVVDDAIVVVENVERLMAQGMSPRDAAHEAMREVSGAVIGVALVLSAVFIPTAFLGGITGKFYQQFALTIAASTVLSAINSLTLSPALAALLLQPHGAKKDVLTRFMDATLGWFFRGFNKVFQRGSDGYAKLSSKLVRRGGRMTILYAGLVGLAGWTFMKVPTGFIPTQDMGYFLVVVQLPDASSFERTDAVVRRMDEMARNTPGVAHTFAISGYSSVLQANQPNVAAAFIIPEAFELRNGDPNKTATALMATLRQKFSVIQEARVLVLPPPPLRGLGNAGGFKLQVQDLNNNGSVALQKAVQGLTDELAKDPDFNSILPGFRASVPQYFMDIDRRQAKAMGVSLSDLNETLQVFLGSAYVNDFNLFGRTYQVTAQAEPAFRATPESVARLRTRNSSGGMVPLGSLVKVQPIAGADRLQRYNLYASGDVSGNISSTLSSGEMIKRVQAAADKGLPPGYTFEWTDLTYQQILAGNSIVWIFPLCVLLVFLVLAALYESWGLPLAVILIVPMCLLSALSGVLIMKMDNNIFTQIGLIVLVGLAAKNAILIVEFARQAEDRGLDRFEAAIEACRLRLRPILMTSLAFILGVLPLVLAQGAGSEMRKALGVAVFYGMIGVTIFGLILTPVFYVVIRKFKGKEHPKVHVDSREAEPVPEHS